MSRYISESLRRMVAERAEFRCEYCRLPETNSFYSFQVDHIISIKHGGVTEAGKLALACTICNRNKGTDLGTVLKDSDTLIRFFNLRKDVWADNFEVSDDGLILSKTPIGEATIKIFGFNHPDSVSERKLLVLIGEFP